MERKQWMENARDKVPAVTGLGFFLLCLWLTCTVALPFWQNGQKDWDRAADLLQQKKKIEAFAQQYDPEAARTKRENTVQIAAEPAPKDGMEAMGKISALAERTQVQVGGLPSPGNGEKAGPSAHGAYFSGGLCSAFGLFPPVERGDALGLLGNGPY